MPTLRHLSCHIYQGSRELREYDTKYADGYVESYIAIPEQDDAFSIRLTTKRYKETGIAAFVWIDGHYMCNRHRVNIAVDKATTTEVEVVKLKQHEVYTGNRRWNAVGFRFSDLDTEAADNEQPTESGDKAQGQASSKGLIEVVILRCDNRSTLLTTAIDIGFDGKDEPIDASTPWVKPYWKTWRKSASTQSSQRMSPQKSSSTRHQRLGSAYTHASRSPQYLDSLNDPFAVFCFKYRSANKIKNDHPDEVAKEELESKKERLMNMSKEELAKLILSGESGGFTYQTDGSPGFQSGWNNDTGGNAPTNNDASWDQSDGKKKDSPNPGAKQDDTNNQSTGSGNDTWNDNAATENQATEEHDWTKGNDENNTSASQAGAAESADQNGGGKDWDINGEKATLQGSTASEKLDWENGTSGSAKQDWESGNEKKDQTSNNKDTDRPWDNQLGGGESGDGNKTAKGNDSKPWDQSGGDRGNW